MACPGCPNTDGGLNSTQVQNLINQSLPSVSDGDYGGYSSKWKFSNAITASAASTEVRLDSATYNAVANIYINETNADSTNVANILASFDNGGNFGYIRLFKEFDSDTFWVGEVTSVTDNGSYYTIGVTYILHNGAFTSADNIVITFSPSGENGTNGTAGADGADGVAVVHSDITDTGVSDAAEAVQKTYDYSADSTILSANGDEIEIHVSYSITSTGGKSLAVYLGDFSGGGQKIFELPYASPLLIVSNKQGMLIIRIKRISATSARIWTELKQGLTTSSPNVLSIDDHYKGQYTQSITFASVSQVDVTARVGAGTPLTINELTVYKYKA